MGAEWNGCNVNILGLTNIKYSHFEIDLHFEYYKVIIREGGQTILISRAEQNDKLLLPLQNESSWGNCMENYMTHVINEAYNLLTNTHLKDNFISAAFLNKRMLSYIKNNGKTGN
jgi:hypothetical protein